MFGACRACWAEQRAGPASLSCHAKPPRCACPPRCAAATAVLPASAPRAAAGLTHRIPNPATPPGDKYVVRLVEDAEGMMEDAMAGPAAPGAPPPEPRVMFEILPAAAAQPQPTAGWTRWVAGVLLLLTLGSTLQFGLAANIGLLPKVRRRGRRGLHAAAVGWEGCAGGSTRQQQSLPLSAALAFAVAGTMPAGAAPAAQPLPCKLALLVISPTCLLRQPP